MKVLVLFIHSLVFVKAAVDFHLQSVNVFARLAIVEADMRAGIGAVEADIVFCFKCCMKNSYISLGQLCSNKVPRQNSICRLSCMMLQIFDGIEWQSSTRQKPNFLAVRSISFCRCAW